MANEYCRLLIYRLVAIKLINSLFAFVGNCVGYLAVYYHAVVILVFSLISRLHHFEHHYVYFMFGIAF
jgi:hypothetical protein